MTLRASPPTLTVVRAATVAPLAAAAPTGPRATSHITLAGSGGLASASSKLRSIRLNAHSTAFPDPHQCKASGTCTLAHLPGRPGGASFDVGRQTRRAASWVRYRSKGARCRSIIQGEDEGDGSHGRTVVDANASQGALACRNLLQVVCFPISVTSLIFTNCLNTPQITHVFTNYPRCLGPALQASLKSPSHLRRR